MRKSRSATPTNAFEPQLAYTIYPARGVKPMPRLTSMAYASQKASRESLLWSRVVVPMVLAVVSTIGASNNPGTCAWVW